MMKQWRQSRSELKRLQSEVSLDFVEAWILKQPFKPDFNKIVIVKTMASLYRIFITGPRITWLGHRPTRSFELAARLGSQIAKALLAFEGAFRTSNCHCTGDCRDCRCNRVG